MWRVAMLGHLERQNGSRIIIAGRRQIFPMATAVSTAVLKTVPLFTSLTEDYLRMLSAAVTRKSAPRSTTIMASGDAIDSLYMILSGRLKVMMSDSDGKEVILSILGPGEFFGEMGPVSYTHLRAHETPE